MEVVNQLPKPEDPAAVDRLLQAQQLLCARFVSEDDCCEAERLLLELAAPVVEGGFGYFPALLTLASLYGSGFEPAIEKDEAKAARSCIRLLGHERASHDLNSALLGDAATQLYDLVKRGTASLSEADVELLGAVADGGGAGSLASVAAFVRLAHGEAQEQLRESKEDPEVREKRRVREAARKALRGQELERQREVAAAALSRVEALRLEGNDACRLGQLPGNAAARQHLERASSLYGSAAEELCGCLGELTLVPEAAAEARQQLSTLRSNEAQVWISQRDWPRARQLAEQSVEDDPENAKARYRVAKALVELHEVEAAAKHVDYALSSLKGNTATDIGSLRSELWRLAEDISQKFPSWKWSSSKPDTRRKSTDDYEQRIVGHWKYLGGSFEIKLENWGALVFIEESMKIDLMRKSKLRWRGELELISGMILNLNYEPGSDVITSEFIPPAHIPEEQRWKGPSKFDSTRIVTTKAPESEEDPPPESIAKPAPVAVQPAQDIHRVVPEVKDKLPVELPSELWFFGNTEFEGQYVLEQGTTQNERPVYRRPGPTAGGEELFLWFRGGNYGVTASLSQSSLAAPFLVRCAEPPARRSNHPLEMRRPRWLVRSGRGQEEFDPAVQLCAGKSEQRLASAHQETSLEMPIDERMQPMQPIPTPLAVTLAGRTGDHAEANGTYDLLSSSWGGRPIYQHAERPLSLFFDHGFWIIAPEVGSFPFAIARFAVSDDALHPAVAGGNWEFMRKENVYGHMVSLQSRTYELDRLVRLCAVELNGQAPPAEAAGHVDSVEEPSTWPVWVKDTRLELRGGEVCVLVVANDCMVISMEQLTLYVGPKVLKVGLSTSTCMLQLKLPVDIDEVAQPKARWSEKTHTLKIRVSRLSIEEPEPFGMD